MSMVSGVAVTLGIAVVTGVDDSVAAVSGVIRGEVGGTGVEDGAACGVGATSVVPHPAIATKDRSNSIKEKASPFPLRGKARMGVRRLLLIHANSTDVAPLPPRSRVSASNDLTSE